MTDRWNGEPRLGPRQETDEEFQARLKRQVEQLTQSVEKDVTPKTNVSYEEACHAMQTGVAHELNADPTGGSPKHLRVGINSAMVTDAALARLLVKKGLITMEEYAEEVRLEMCREVDRYEERINEKVGGGNRIKLA